MALMPKSLLQCAVRVMWAILQWILIGAVCRRTYSGLPGTCSCCPGLWGSEQYRGTGQHRWTARTLGSERRPVRRSVRQRFHPSSAKRKAELKHLNILQKRGKNELHCYRQSFPANRNIIQVKKNNCFFHLFIIWVTQTILNVILKVWQISEFKLPQCYGQAALLANIKSFGTIV